MVNSINHIKVYLNNLSDRSYWCILLLPIAIIFLLLGKQTFCMSDEGFILVAGQNIFEDPAHVAAWGYYWGVIVTGIWNLLFGEYGIYAFRVLRVIMYLCSASMVYLILKEYMNRWIIFLGIWLAISASTDFIVFRHNDLSGFLNLVTVFFIMKAIRNEKACWMLVAGIIMGLNFYVRVVNISLSMMIFVLLIYHHFKKDTTKSLHLFYYALCGTLIGVSFTFLTMIILGHWNFFIDFYLGLQDKIGENNSNHNASFLMDAYLLDIKIMVTHGIAIFSLPTIIFLFRKRTSQNIIFVTFYILLLLIYVFFLKNEIVNGSYFTRGIYPMAIVAILYLVKKKKTNMCYLCVSYLAIVIMIFYPLGGNWGVLNQRSNAIWLSCPFVFDALYVFFQKHRREKWICYMYITCLTLFIFIFYKQTRAFLGPVWYEDGNRWEKFCKINHPLASVYTTKEVANEMDVILRETNKYVKEGDRVLFFESWATLHYLTKTIPFFKSPWPTSIDIQRLKNMVNKAIEEDPHLPVILRNKTYPITVTRPYKDWNNSQKKNIIEHNSEHIAWINGFVREHHYRKVFEDDCFMIYLPPHFEQNHSSN